MKVKNDDISFLLTRIHVIKIDGERFHIFPAITGFSLKILGNILLMTILNITDFTQNLEDTSLEKLQWAIE